GEGGEPEACRDQALVRGEAVEGDALGAADPDEGETALERGGIWLSRGPGPGRKGDPALSGQGARVHAPGAREPVVSPTDGEHGLVVDARGYQLWMRVYVVAEAEGGIAATDQLTHFPAEGRPHPQIDARVELAKPAEPRGERGTGQGADHGQGDGAPVGAAQSPHGVDPVPHAGEQGFGVREKGPSRLGEDGAAPDPLEEGSAQLVLQEVEAAADRGLREVQRGGSASEAADAHAGH